MNRNSPINNQRIGALGGGSGASRYQNSTFVSSGEIAGARSRVSQLRSGLNRSDGLGGAESRASFHQSTQEEINFYAAITNGNSSDEDPSSIALDEDSTLRGFIDPRDLITREARSRDAFDTTKSKVVDVRNTQKEKDDPLHKFFKHLGETLFKEDNAESFFKKYSYSNQNTHRGNVQRDPVDETPIDPRIRRSHQVDRYGG